MGSDSTEETPSKKTQNNEHLETAWNWGKKTVRQGTKPQDMLENDREFKRGHEPRPLSEARTAGPLTL